jgi:holo-ACP synthase
MEAEELSPVGRLWDFDVFDANGVLYSRSQFNLPTRHCLICDNEAKVCARQRSHSLEEILRRIEELAYAPAKN